MISKTINCNVAFETLALILLWGMLGVLVKMQTEHFLKSLKVQIIDTCSIDFFTVLQNLMAFVEKLQPVEKVDLSDVEIGTLSSDKILEVTSLRKGSQQRLICGGRKMKSEFWCKNISSRPKIATLAFRTPMCVTVANSPKRHIFLTNLSSLIAASPNMVLTKKQRKDGDGRTFYTSTHGWNGKYAQVRVENEDKRFAWFIHAFLGVWGVGWLPLVTSCVSL